MQRSFPTAVIPSEGLDELTGEDVEAVARVVRLAMGKATQEDQQFVHRAAKAWLMSNGSIPFERGLRLPSTPDAFRRMQRDVWLCHAMREMRAATDWEASSQLLREWDHFLSRGPWRTWRDDPEPPPWATPLQCALFFASRFNRGNSLGERQLYRITRHVFRLKSQ